MQPSRPLLVRLLLVALGAGALLTCGGGTEPSPNGPAPVITGVTPDSIVSGSLTTTVTVTGQHFEASSVVQWNNAARQTTYVSATQIKGLLAAGDLGIAATGTITVASVGSRVSNGLPIYILNEVATIASLVPSSMYAGTTDTSVTVNGAGIRPGAAVAWDGVPLPSTQFPTAVRATVSAGLLATSGTHTLTLVNPAPGGGASAGQTFTVMPAPVVGQVTPDSVTWAAYPTLFTVRGSHFGPGAQVYWNTQPAVTTVVSDSVLTCFAPNPLLEQLSGQVQVTVHSPLPLDLTSNTVAVIVGPPAPDPQTTSVTPQFVTVGSGPTTITVRGRGFFPTSIIVLNGVAPGPTTVLNDSTATVVVTNPGPVGFYNIVVLTTALPGGVSADRVFTVADNGTRAFNALPLEAAYAVSDTLRGLVYASSPSRGKVFVIDPVAGIVTDSMPASVPGPMVISADGSHLYVWQAQTATIGIFNLQTRSLAGSFQLAGGVGYPATFTALPGTSQSVAITVADPSNGTFLGAVVVDGTVERSATVGGLQQPVALVAPGDTLVADSGTGLAIVSIAGDGLHFEAMPPAFTNLLPADLAIAGRRLFTGSGLVLDLDSRSVTDTLPFGSYSNLNADPATQRLLAVEGFARVLAGFSTSSLQSLGPSQQLPGAPGQNSVSAIERWGSDGLVYVDGGTVIMLRSTLVGP